MQDLHKMTFIDVLGVDLPKVDNSISSILGLYDLMHEFPWIGRSAVKVGSLLRSKLVMCDFCVGHGTRGGTFLARAAAAREHQKHVVTWRR